MTLIWIFPAYMDLFWFLISTCCCCVFYGDYFVAFAVVIAAVVYFECVDFVLFAAGAVHRLFVDCVPTVAEVVVAAVVVAVNDIVVVTDLR